MKYGKFLLFFMMFAFLIPNAVAKPLENKLAPWKIKQGKYDKEFYELYKTKLLLEKTRGELHKIRQKIKALEWSHFIGQYKKQLLERTEKYTQKESNWSFFFNADRKNIDIAEQFEWGVRFYYTRQDMWDFARYEPFIKVKKALFKNRLYIYGLLVLESTRVNYKLNNYQSGTSDISLRATFGSDTNPSFGAGLQVFLLSWKKFNLYGYGQIQTTNKNDAELKSATFVLNGTEFDMYEAASEHLNADYFLRRHDCGMIGSYQFFSWLTFSLFVGYIWFNATVELTMDEELASTIRLLTRNNPRDVIPNRLSIDLSSPFGMLKIKSRIYKRLHVGLEGTAMPGEKPIYFGSISLIIEN